MSNLTRMNYAVTLPTLLSFAVVAAFTGCATLLDGCTSARAVSVAIDPGPKATALPASSLTARRSRERPSGSSGFSVAIERLTASVVAISAVKIVPIELGDRDTDPGREALAERLRERGIPLVQSEPPRIALREVGCGVITRGDGYILTAAHVVDEAAVVTVQLHDGRDFPGRIVGIDLPSDVAVIKIEANELPTVTLGSSSRLKPGTSVAAIGSPFGLKGSVAVGVVSALDRTLPGDDSYVPFVQTDLPLNPGTSGGPLLDEQGAVVGINSQVAWGEDGESGVSFAIPIEIAQRLEEELIRTGRVERGDLGAAFQDMDTQLARAFGRSTANGALLHTIRAGGAAAHANLRAGDIIVEIAGRAVQGASDLASTIGSARPGSTVLLGVWRAHRLMHVPVRLEAADRSGNVSPSSGSAGQTVTPVLSVRELKSSERRELATSGHLLVTGESERAVAAGIALGDVVLGTSDATLRSAEELSRALTRNAGVLALLIEHQGMRTFVAIPLSLPAQNRVEAPAAARPSKSTGSVPLDRRD